MMRPSARLPLLLVTALLLALAFAAPALATAPVLETPITLSSLIKGDQPEGLYVNSSFLPSAAALKAKQPFVGLLHLEETKMSTDPDPLTSGIVFGKDPAYFPEFSIGFFTDRGRLVPKTQEIIRAGSIEGVGTSYWDVIVGPGRVWSEPGEQGWSRASFPFVLMHVIEGESHNGVATFAYKGKRVSHVQFQVVQQTSPFYIVDFFTSWGTTDARYRHGLGHMGSMARQKVTWRRAQKAAFPSAPWAALEKKVGAAALEGFAGDIAAADFVVQAFVYRGVLYRQASPTPAGPYPYPDEMRFGVWSQTKSLALGLALARLMQKYGPGVLDARLVEYVPEAVGHGWDDVTFEHLANMASGHGFGSNVAEPPDINSGYLDGDYLPWYEAPTMEGKLALGLDDPAHPWEPGTVARYRDQDAFLYGVALDRYLKAREGPKADIWNMLRREVYAPIGIYYAPHARTIEEDGSRGQAMMMYGYYPTLADEARVAQLLHRKGAWRGRQLLYKPFVAALQPATAHRGLPTGKTNQYYWRNFWINPYQPMGADSLWYFATMQGWGGNLTVLMPKGMTGIRMGKVWDSALDYANPNGMLTVADRLGAFDD